MSQIIESGTGRIDLAALSPAAKGAMDEVWVRSKERYSLREALAGIAAVTAEVLLDDGLIKGVDTRLDDLKYTIRRAEREAVGYEKDAIFSEAISAVVVGMRAAMREKLKELNASEGTLSEGTKGF